jgi:hypothetical protein
MNDDFVYYTYVDVTDEKVFTFDLTEKWKDDMLDSYEEVFTLLKSKVDPVSSISFFISESLMDEVIADAVIGMRKITNSREHSVSTPNTFKIAGYLSYWWMRHKPVSINYPNDVLLEDVKIVDGKYEDKEKEQEKLIWRLKHINELVAVQMVVSYIFKFNEELCNIKECKRVKKTDKNYCFKDFLEMKEAILKKLTYYFAYRPITPKVIEHILEGYTFHPAWKLTGPLWSMEKNT